MDLKKYLIYYFEIIPIICFLISHQLFSAHITYALVRRYSTNKPGNNDIDSNEEVRIYGKIYIADW